MLLLPRAVPELRDVHWLLSEVKHVPPSVRMELLASFRLQALVVALLSKSQLGLAATVRECAILRRVRVVPILLDLGLYHLRVGNLADDPAQNFLSTVAQGSLHSYLLVANTRQVG